MLDKIKPTKHALQRITYVPQVHMIAELLLRFGREDERGRVFISAKDVTAVASEARASGLYALARDVERAARVAFVLAGDVLVTLFHVTEPAHRSSRYNYRRSCKQASQRRRQRIA